MRAAVEHCDRMEYRTVHIEAKYYYTKDLISKGLVRLIHCPTNIMIADIVTKNLPGPVFNVIKSILLNNTLVSVDKYQLLLDSVDSGMKKFILTI